MYYVLDADYLRQDICHVHVLNKQRCHVRRCLVQFTNDVDGDVSVEGNSSYSLLLIFIGK